jgi:hypothetical protein
MELPYTQSGDQIIACDKTNQDELCIAKSVSGVVTPTGQDRIGTCTCNSHPSLRDEPTTRYEIYLIYLQLPASTRSTHIYQRLLASTNLYQIYLHLIDLPASTRSPISTISTSIVCSILTHSSQHFNVLTPYPPPYST